MSLRAGADSAWQAAAFRSGIPDTFEPDLARGLWGYPWVRAAGEVELPQALTTAEESVTRYQGLVDRRPQMFTGDLVGALTTLADVLAGLGRAEEAAAARAQRSAEKADAVCPGAVCLDWRDDLQGSG